MKNKEKVDILFITNVPAFYKINLYNELAKKIKIKVIFISSTSEIREPDFTNKTINFSHVVINSKEFESRNSFLTLIKIYNEIRKINYNIIIYPGWEIKELFFLSLLFNKKKNAVAIESSILESSTSGFKNILKNIFIKRMSKAYPSGSLQLEILKALNYNGKVYITHGVGIPNNPTIKPALDINKKMKDHISYLYIGRLSPEKNLELLINTFNNLSNILYIVGSGSDELKLKNIAKPNVIFLGYVNNRELNKIYSQADVFILPSKIEPWGLVIDEAIYYNLPVIISDRVGCKDDLLINNNGLVFKYDNQNDLVKKIEIMNNNFYSYYQNTAKIDINSFYKKQINVYLESIYDTKKQHTP